MNIADIVAVASFAISMSAIIFVIGKNTQRLETCEKDLNSVGKTLSEELPSLDERLDKQGIFLTRVDQRVLNLEERSMGEDTVGRMRK